MHSTMSDGGWASVWLIGLALAITGVWGCAATAAEKAELVVQAGQHDRAMVPMCVEAPAGLTTPQMIDADTNKPVPCQLADGKLWWILDTLPAGQTKRYRVTGGEPAKGGVEITKAANVYNVTIGGKPFTTLVCDPEEIRPFCYPLFGPGQVRMTRGYPMEDIEGERRDHHHHRSFYVAYGEFQNGKYNFWHEPRDKAGKPKKDEWDRQVVREIVKAEGGPVFGTIEALIDWTGRDKVKVLEERRRLTFYALDGAARMLDLAVCFDAKYGDVHFGDTKEAGICALRVAKEIRENGTCGGLLTNSEGQKTMKQAWGKNATWVDYSRTKGQQYGIAAFDTPGNLRYPTRWHVRDYGLFTANPFGIRCFDSKKEKGDYVIKKGEKLVLRYRLYLHQGDCQGAKVAERYQDYIDPPKATWK